MPVDVPSKQEVSQAIGVSGANLDKDHWVDEALT
jgi:uncharacterized protein GlcG (DUF336 family)